MRFQDLQVFVEVVEAGGMTQAAALKGVSQPGLSRTIRDLETRMGVRLLNRTGRGVELTPAGIEFLAFARSSLQNLEETEGRLRDLSGTLPDKLRIAIPTRLGGVVFPELYRRFMLEMPEVAITASEVQTAEMAEGLNAGRFDLLVTYLEKVPGSLGGEAVFSEKLYLVERKVSGKRDGKPIKLSKAAKRPLLLNYSNSAYFRLIESAFEAAGQPLSVQREIETAEGLLAFASEGEGATILPYSNFHAEAARGEVTGRPLTDPPIERKIYLHASRSIGKAAARAATQLALSCLKKRADDLRWEALS